MQMTLYRGNRVDGEYQRDIPELAREFWASKQAELAHQGMRLDRALRSFLTDPDGINSTWVSEIEYADLFQVVHASWPKPQA